MVADQLRVDGLDLIGEESQVQVDDLKDANISDGGSSSPGDKATGGPGWKNKYHI